MKPIDETLRIAFQQIFTDAECFALVTAVTNCIMSVKKSCDKNNSEVASLLDASETALVKVLASMSDEMQKLAKEGIEVSVLNYSVKNVFSNDIH